MRERESQQETREDIRMFVHAGGRNAHSEKERVKRETPGGKVTPLRDLHLQPSVLSSHVELRSAGSVWSECNATFQRETERPGECLARCI